MHIMPTPTQPLGHRAPEEAHQELLEAWHGHTHPAVRQRRGSLLASVLMAFAGPFILAATVYWVALKELWVITAVTVARHALDLVCIGMVLYVLVALQLVEDVILFLLFCGATEILARIYKRAHHWARDLLRLRRQRKLDARRALEAAKALPLPPLSPPGTRFNCAAHFVRARRCHCLPRLQTPPGLRVDGIAGTFYVLLGAGVVFDVGAFIHRVWS